MRHPALLLLTAKLAGTMKLIGQMDTNKSAHAAVPAAHRILQNEQPGNVRQAQFRCAKCRRFTMDAFQCQAPALGKETEDPAGIGE
jgi:hypothetical protein